MFNINEEFDELCEFLGVLKTRRRGGFGVEGVVEQVSIVEKILNLVEQIMFL